MIIFTRLPLNSTNTCRKIFHSSIVSKSIVLLLAGLMMSCSKPAPKLAESDSQVQDDETLSQKKGSGDQGDFGGRKRIEESNKNSPVGSNQQNKNDNESTVKSRSSQSADTNTKAQNGSDSNVLKGDADLSNSADQGDSQKGYKFHVGNIRPTNAANGKYDRPYEYKKYEGLKPEYYRGKFDFYKVAVQHFLEHSQLLEDEKTTAAPLIESFFANLVGVEAKHTWQEIADGLFPIKNKHMADPDPLVHFCYAACLYHMKKYQVSRLELPFAIRAMSKSNYPGRIAVLPHSYLVMATNLSQQMAPGRQYRSRDGSTPEQNYLESFIYWIEMDLSANEIEHRYVYEQMTHLINHIARDGRMLAELRKWALSSKRLPPWIREMGLGLGELKIAWQARGTGVASTVSENGWREYRARQQSGAQHLLKADEINPHYPESSFQMMSIALDGDTEKPIEWWFRETVERQFDYYQAYDMQMKSLMPRWGGSHEELMEFGRQCYETGRFETNIPYLLIEALKRVIDDRGVEVLSDQTIYEAADSCLEKYIEQFKSEGIEGDPRGRIVLSKQAVLNSAFGKHEKAKKLYDELGEDLLVDANREFALNISAIRYRRISSAAVGTSADAAKKLEALWNEDVAERYDNRQVIDELINTGMNNMYYDKYEDEFWEAYSEINQLEKQFERGEWVELKFSEGLTNWVAFAPSQFDFTGKNELTVDSKQSKKLAVLKHLAAFPGPRAIEFEIEMVDPVVEPDSPYQPTIWCGISLGEIKFDNSITTHTDVVVARNPRRDLVSAGNAGGDLMVWRIPELKKIAKIQFFNDKHYVEYRVDGRLVSLHHWDRIDPGPFVAITAGNRRNISEAIFKIRNLRIRKWELGDPGKGAEQSFLCDYWDKRIELVPDDPVNWEQLAVSAYYARELERSLEACKKVVEFGEDHAIVGFIRGAIADEKGDKAAAFKYYEQAADATLRGPFFHKHVQPTSFESVMQLSAIYRYIWIALEDPTYAKKNAAKLRGLLNTPWQYRRNKFEAAMLRAQHAAFEGNFEVALKIASDTRKQSPPYTHPTLDKQIEAYKNKKMYSSDAKDERFWNPVQ